MPFVNPPNFVAGAVLTEAQLDILSDNETFLANPPKCRVFHSAAISVASGGGGQALTFDSERFDTDTLHSTVTNPSRITITTGGTYLLGGHLVFVSTTATGNRAAWFQLNGTATRLGEVEMGPPASTDVALSPTTLYHLSAGDYVELFAFQTSGAALNVLALANYSPEFWAIFQSL